ncbi:MAG TPA: hypothetical protein VLI04_13675 [Nocardioidaceae bacterium]|nr:hypothetical protein [Nocardioidaceae bacterium]
MPNNGPRPPRTQEERELERTQRAVTQGVLADERRKHLILSLYRSGMSQVELAARLSRAARAAGGQPIGEDAVNKLVKRYRDKKEYA